RRSKPAMPEPAKKDAKPEIAGAGAQRAAAVLLGLGRETATVVFRLLDEPSIRQIALGARELRRQPDLVQKSMEAFVQAMGSLDGDAEASDGLLREIATTALGSEAARRAFEGIVPPPPVDEVLGPVAFADVEALAMVLGREQPQTIALVLGSIDEARAGAILKLLPDTLRPQVLRRLATLESGAPAVLKEVGEALQAELLSSAGGSSRRVDGRAAAVAMLRKVPAAQQTEVVGEIEKEDPELAAELRSKLFTFEDIGNLNDRDIQTFIREIDTSRLAVALKGSSPSVAEKVLKNMSSRAAEMMRDEIAAMGPLRLAAVEEAQGELVKVAFNLVEQGRITLVGPSDKMV
ncbi:MAG TPA: FliG C-terminal domain-containing protein, partial [Polyangia bacterium]